MILAGALPDVVRRGGSDEDRRGGCDTVLVVVINGS
jgi:hypothetical protein